MSPLPQRQDGDSLLGFVSSVAGAERLKVEENLGDGFVRLRVGEAERRQAKHDIRFVEDAVIELLRNSRDAGAHHIFLATSREAGLRRLICIDDGEGIPEHLHEAIFEPRVTSRLDSMTIDSYGVHGRGMALYSIWTNMVETRVAGSAPGMGAAVLATADTSRLPERKDQSSWPKLTTSDGQVRVAKGPHNILRALAEFSLAHPDIHVYVGSPADVLATMRDLAGRRHPMGRLFDQAAGHKLPLWQQVATAVDSAALCKLSSNLFGFAISQRTAQRILAEEIAVLAPMGTMIGATGDDNQRRPPVVDLAKDRRSVRIEQADLDELARAATRAFASVASKYYLDADAQPRVVATSDEIRIRLRLRKLE